MFQASVKQTFGNDTAPYEAPGGGAATVDFPGEG
jgi:hypothetical protein